MKMKGSWKGSPVSMSMTDRRGVALLPVMVREYVPLLGVIPAVPSVRDSVTDMVDVRPPIVKVNVGLNVCHDTDRCWDRLRDCSMVVLNVSVAMDSVTSAVPVSVFVWLRSSVSERVRSLLIVTVRYSVIVVLLENGALSLNERTVNVGSLVKERDMESSSESEKVEVVDFELDC